MIFYKDFSYEEWFGYLQLRIYFSVWKTFISTGQQNHLYNME